MRICDNWNPHDWIESYTSINKNLHFGEKRTAYRELLRRVYWTTIEAAISNGYTLQDGRKIDIPVSSTLYENTKMYCHQIFPETESYYVGMQVDVVDDDCLSVAERLIEDGERPAVLNMASPSNPGGSVLDGAFAQEEYLFRCSNYFQSLYQFVDFGGMYGVERNPDESYPLDPDFGGVFSRGVTIFRGRQEEGYPFLEKPWQVDFIAVAERPRLYAINLLDESMLFEDCLLPRAVNKIRTIFNIAIDNGVKSLVLGAFGCGPFGNPPEHIARLFKEILDDPRYRNAFRHVVFAIKNDQNTRNDNDGKSLFQIFRDELAS